MPRLGEDAGRRPLLHDPAGVHDSETVGHSSHDPEVVGDEDQRHVALGLLALQQLEQLRLDRHVERGRRLVGDHDLGVCGEGHCNGDPLP